MDVLNLNPSDTPPRTFCLSAWLWSHYFLLIILICKEATLDSHCMNFIFKAIKRKHMQSYQDQPFFHTSSDYMWGDFSNCKIYYKIIWEGIATTWESPKGAPFFVHASNLKINAHQ